MTRALITAGIEYFLAYVVFRYGKAYKDVVGWILIFLATYQLGEVLIFYSHGSALAFKVAYVSTTLLPPLGILLVSQILKKELGYRLFQSISALFVLFILLTPSVAVQFSLTRCCVQVLEYVPIMRDYWLSYYQGALVFAMGAALLGYVMEKDTIVRKDLLTVLLAYLSFDGIAMVLYWLLPTVRDSVASVMCALAVFAAFLLARIPLKDLRFEVQKRYKGYFNAK